MKDSEKRFRLLIALGCLTFKEYILIAVSNEFEILSFSSSSSSSVWKYCLLRNCILSVFANNNRLKPFKFFYALGAICRWSCLPCYLRYSGDTVHSNQSFVGRVVLTNCLCRWLNSNSIRYVYETDTFAVVIEPEYSFEQGCLQQVVCLAAQVNVT